ncbi:MAG TPA: hypothetical protein VEZ88_03250 [Steroidobacteraceae bacterium]|nr:hypothetical protein [Steroidobacteraceae bacterium]
MSIPIRLGLLLAASVVAGCGGNGGRMATPAPVDAPPALTVIADQSLDQDTSTAALPFGVSDRETAAAGLAVSATSSDTSVIAPEGLVLDGSGATRTLTITPVEAAFGNATISMSVRDGAGQSVARSFVVTVKPVYVSFTQFTTDTFGATEDSQVRTLQGFTLDSDADENPAAFDGVF